MAGRGDRQPGIMSSAKNRGHDRYMKLASINNSGNIFPNIHFKKHIYE
jgi:hypothetical protein